LRALIDIVLPVLRGLVPLAVSESGGDRRREFIPAATTRAISGEESAPTLTNTGRNTRACRIGPVLSVDTCTGDSQIEYVRPLAPNCIPTVLEVQISTGRAATTFQEPANTHYQGWLKRIRVGVKVESPMSCL
jgi:hypothetical protein